MFKDKTFMGMTAEQWMEADKDSNMKHLVLRLSPGPLSDYFVCFLCPLDIDGEVVEKQICLNDANAWDDTHTSHTTNIARAVMLLSLGDSLFDGTYHLDDFDGSMIESYPELLVCKKLDEFIRANLDFVTTATVVPKKNT